MTISNSQTLVQAIHEAGDTLAAAGIGDGRFEARLLLQQTLTCSTTELYLRLDEPIGEQEARFVVLVERRALREPLPYITGYADFCGLDIFVDWRVMVPRPETETLVEAVLDWARHRGGRLEGADVGTGSGCVALALAAGYPTLRLYATDISPSALDVAQYNVRHYGLVGDMTFLEGHLFDPLPGPVDFLVANLPYIPTGEFESLMPEVRDYEPRLALDGGSDGLDMVRQLLETAPAALRPKGGVFLEIGAGQGERVLELARLVFPDASVSLLPDLAGIPRVLAVRL